jgi:hypothetical protein
MKLSELRIAGLLAIAKDQVEQNKGYRLGQAFFNLLPEKIRERVRATPLDPFYNDNKLQT